MKSLIAMLIPTVPTASTYLHLTIFPASGKGIAYLKIGVGIVKGNFVSVFFKYLLLYPDHAFNTRHKKLN